jgi:hypothetical protein
MRRESCSHWARVSEELLVLLELRTRVPLEVGHALDPLFSREASAGSVGDRAACRHGPGARRFGRLGRGKRRCPEKDARKRRDGNRDPRNSDRGNGPRFQRFS